MAITYEALEFLGDNAYHNSREWFEAHRDVYKSAVVAPLTDLVRALESAMKNIDPLIVCSPKVDGSISRIYRDTRFSRDKSLYRDTAWIVFMRDKKLYGALPGFFMEFSPSKFRYGCGYYSAGTDSLNSLRTLILEGDRSFVAAKAAYESQDVFDFEGEKYKRSRYPDMPEDVRDWLDRRNFDFIRNSEDFSLLTSDNLQYTLARDFALLRPIYDFMIRAESRKAHLKAVE